MTKYISVIGLGFGDEGKGSIVDYLCAINQNKKILIIRPNGGCQSAHHVVTPDGKTHRFSQVGSGFLNSYSETFLDKNFIVNLNYLDEEIELLGDPIVYVHNKCLVSTDLHIIANNIRSNATDTCGFGIGDAREYWIKYGNDALFVEDVGKGDWYDKVELLRQRLCYQYPQYATNIKKVNVYKPKKLYHNSDYISRYKYDLVIFEHSQGVLLDEYIGIGAPVFCTWSDTTDRHTKEFCSMNNISYDDDVRKIGVLRTYLTRHGDGPFMEDIKLTADLPELHNLANKFQGRFRCGFHEQKTISNALENVTLDEIAWTHVDRYPIPAFDGLPPNIIHSHGPTWTDKFIQEGCVSV